MLDLGKSLSGKEFKIYYQTKKKKKEITNHYTDSNLKFILCDNEPCIGYAITNNDKNHLRRT